MRSLADVAMAQTRPRWPVLAGALSVVGMGVALYLTQLHYEGSEALCRGVGSCAEVNDSEYATIGPLPVALLGFGAYATMLAIAVAAHLRPAGAPLCALAVFGIALTGAGYSGYLTYVELFVIEAICPWCVVSAVVMTALLATTIRPALAPPGAR